MKQERIPLRRLRREMARERAKLVEQVERHIRGIWPTDQDPLVPTWVMLDKLWHGPKEVQLSFGKLVAFTELRLPVFQVTLNHYQSKTWWEFPLEDLWEVLPTIRKMRGLAKGARVTDPFEERETPSPRYYYWARRAAAGFVPNARYCCEDYYQRCLILGVTNKEREVIEAMFEKNKERL